MTYHPRNPGDLAFVEALAERLKAEWRDQPNVVQIAPGLKLQGGKAQVDELVLTFFVREKVAPDEAARLGWRLIPTAIEGVRTDVEPTKRRALASALPARKERRDPLVGGIAIGNGNYQWHWGTLGGIVFENTSDAAKALTNEHVLVFTNEGEVGDPVIQPAPPRVEDFIDIDFTPDCCPIGPIFFVETGGPVSAFLAWCAVVAGIAALADKKDPHQRGREATMPAPGEQTVREPVSVQMRYPDFPIPGTPYHVKVSWDYTRMTTGASYDYHVEEVNQNPHVLAKQVLMTDRHEYVPGQIVHLLAALVSPQQTACSTYHAIAYLVPGAKGQQHRSHMTVLQPVTPAQLRALRKLFPDIEIAIDTTEECDDYGDLKVGDQLPKKFIRNKHVYVNLDGSFGLHVSDWPGEQGISFGDGGLRIDLDEPVKMVTARVGLGTSHPIVLKAFDAGGNLVDQVQTPGQNGIHELIVEAEGIRRLIFSGGGNEAVLLELCVGEETVGHACYYYGRVVLDAFDPLGPWRTHLFAQTVNDVAEGTKPTVAAQTIGGMPVTQNFEYVGEGRVPPYDEGCIFRPSVDGDFEVVSP